RSPPGSSLFPYTTLFRSANPDQPLFGQYFAHRSLHRDGAVRAAPQTETFGSYREFGRRSLGFALDVSRALPHIAFFEEGLESRRKPAPYPRFHRQEQEENVSDKNQNLQDIFLNALRKSKTPVTMFLVKGVKLQGIITWFDNFSLLLRRDGQSQLVYKHAISTVMPSHDFDLSLLGDNLRDAPASKGKALQDVFLNAVRRSDESVTM